MRIESLKVELPLSEFVVEVNGQPISANAVQSEAAAMRELAAASGDSLSPERRLAIRSEAIQRLIDLALMQQEARRLGFAPDASAVESALAKLAPRFDGVVGCRAASNTPELRREAEDRLLIDMLLDRWFARVRAPRLSEVREHYRQHREKFWTPELVGAAHIVKNVQPGETPEPAHHEMRRIRDLLISGADFADTARRFSDCGADGGDLGHFPRGHMVEEFDQVVFSTPPGTLTGIFLTRFGFHVAFVYDRKPEGMRTLEEVKPQIEQTLLRQKQDREVGLRLTALRERATVRQIFGP